MSKQQPAPNAANSGATKKKRGEHLKQFQFKPGQSGNPSGRPKKPFITEALEELLEEKLMTKEGRQQFKEAMWAKLLSGKVVGSMTLDTILDRTEGKVVQPVKADVNMNVSLAELIQEARERVDGTDGGGAGDSA